MNQALFSRKKRKASIIINDYSIRFLDLKQTKQPIVAKWKERILP